MMEEFVDENIPASSLFSDPAYKLDMRQGYLIANPRELIHQYATTTPVAIMEASDNTPATMTVSKQSMYRRTEETSELVEKKTILKRRLNWG